MKLFLSLVFIVSFSIRSLLAQDVFGKWKTMDDNTGEALSIVEIYEKNGKVYGKIVDILNPEEKEDICEKCKGDRKNKPIMGMVIINGLTKDDDEYNGGKILDPDNGKEYKCYITLEEPDKLKLRGYIGFSLMGRTQYWERVE